MDKLSLLKKIVKTKKVSVFIDASNILYSQQSLGWEIDYRKLSHYLSKNFNIIRIYFYSGKVSSNKRQLRFFQFLKKLGFTLKTKEVKWIKDRHGKILKGKGNIDIELALDFTHTTREYDVAFLLSGDSDFVPAVKFVRKLNKYIAVFSTRNHVAKELIEASNLFIPFTELRNNLERRK